MGIKILLADDSATAQNMGKKILSEAGHEVVTVSNGAAAAKKIAEVKPSLVLLDVFMPGYSGLELCEKLRAAADTAKLPVLLTVGRMEPYNPQDGARVKADGIIVKPFEASDLIAAVDRLAEKLAPAKKVVPESEPTLKIAPPAESKNESHLQWKQAPPTHGEEAPAAKASDSKNYEQTMRLDASQIAAMLNSASAAKQKESAPATEEFHVAPALPATDAAMQAFGEEADAISPVTAAAQEPAAAMPSYMDQYLTGETAFSGEPAASESAAPAAAFEPVMMERVSQQSVINEFAPTIMLPKDALLERIEDAASLAAPVASAEGLELTAAAPVADLPVAQEPGFEPTLQSAETPAVVMPDPAFVRDQHHATMDFATQFGISETPVSPEFAAHAEPSGPVDDFEARLNAVMASSYEESGTDLPTLTRAMETTSEAPGTDFQAQLDQAMYAFDAPAEPMTETAPAEAAGLETSHLPSLHEEPSVASEPELVVAQPEFASNEIGATANEPEISVFSGVESASSHQEPGVVEAVSSTLIPALEPEQAAASREAAEAPDTDEAVIQQMREAISHLPVDSSHAGEPEPMALAAAAGVAPAVVRSPLGREAELEIARSLGAAMGVESSAQHHESPAQEETAGSRDANNLAAAVENVMKRELPNLIWKIMAEIDLRKR